MSASDWNFRLAADLQDYAWDCSACSLAWCLRTIDIQLSEQDVIQGLGPARISPQHGLLDASGAGLVSYLAEIGVSAENNPNASFADVVAAAGFQPMVIGGRSWNHWSAVRMGGPCAGYDPDSPIFLMNPSDGWMGVGQILSSDQFHQLGSFSAVWFTGW